MNQDIFQIIHNEEIASRTFRMELQSDASGVRTPGQFVNLKLPGFYARRPISVCDYTETTVTLLYKCVGDGTEAMSRMHPGTELDLLTGLGNGFRTDCAGEAPLLLGGGIGSAPLFCLCKKLLAEGKHPRVILGFNTAAEVILAEEFHALGVPLTIATADGSTGCKGFVTDVLPQDGYTYFYTCGPMPMLRAVYAKTVGSGQFSFEARMGCGFGACMACSCKTNFGSKRVCKDGPVFEKEEILWEN